MPVPEASSSTASTRPTPGSVVDVCAGLVRRSHDPTRLGLSFSADDMSRAMEGVSRRSPGVASLPLQLRQASHGVEVRTRDEDASDPGWTDAAAAELKGDLLIANCFFGSGEGHVCIR